MAEIAKEKRDLYVQKMAELDKNAKTEKKALAISKNMAVHCASFVTLGLNACEKGFAENRVFRQSWHCFDDCKPDYDSLNSEDKEIFLVFAFAVSMIKCCFYYRKKNLLAAKENHTAEEVFEARIIVGVIEEIFKEWQKFWDENGVIKCRIIK